VKDFAATATIGLLAIVLTVSEWRFTSRTKVGQAVVVSGTNGGVVFAPGRSGRTMADVVVSADGGQFRATLRAWYRVFRTGQEVRVLYLPDEPGDVLLDSFWQCHFGSIIAMAAVGLMFAFDYARFASRLRRPSSSLLMSD
jgi:hypothetical protein